MLLAAPLWLQIGLGSTTLFVDAPPRGGLLQGGVLDCHVGTWTTDRVAVGGRARLTVGGVLSLAIDGPETPDATGALALATGGAFVRLSPWGGAVVELEAFGGGGVGPRAQPAAGGTLRFGWTWWGGARRWGVEGWAEGAGGGAAWFGTGVALTVGDARPTDPARPAPPR